jgi:hypothetical protein
MVGFIVGNGVNEPRGHCIGALVRPESEIRHPSGSIHTAEFGSQRFVTASDNSVDAKINELVC